ncbi:hypothetical protein ALP51_01896 [Pseudomonas savastanoi]|uniref:SMEK domain-containing protein n=2 Tax=Pseudomonas savastanoi TaxID=29438 RepID=A0A3M5K103_PSESS|nr:hypothetical protein ALP51_01896 [Pseudomonas savastanoi]
MRLPAAELQSGHHDIGILCMAIKREEIIKNIIGMFTRFSDKVLFENAVGFLDINKSAEPLFMGVLNRVYDLQLKNMNSIQRNYPAIDLGDEGSGICYQITSLGTNEKYNHTLEKYKEKKLGDKFRELRFLLIGENNITKKDPDVRTKVFTLKSLIQDIDEMPDRDLEEFEQYFSIQMNENRQSSSILPVPLLAPDNSDSYENFLSYLKIDGDERDDAIADIKEFLNVLRNLNNHQRQLLYFMVRHGHFPNSSSRRKGNTDQVYIAYDLVYEEIGRKNEGVLRSLDHRNLIHYRDDYTEYLGGDEIRAFELYWSGKLSELNMIAAVKDFVHDDPEALYDFFVNTSAADLA